MNFNNFNKRIWLAEEKFRAGDEAFNSVKYQQAADNFLAAAELWKEVKGHEVNYAACLVYAAHALSELGYYDKAKSLLEKAIPIQKKILGTEHPDVASSLSNLATIYAGQGDYKKAKQLYEKALAIREKTLGIEHPDVASTLNNLALVHEAQGNTEKATEYYQRAKYIIDKVFQDENHPTAKIISQNYLKLQQEVETLKSRDIQQRVALEEAKKLEHLSYMATGIAHNINNPVGIIRLAAQRGLREMKKGITAEKGEEIFQRILKHTDRLHSITENFRNYSNGDRKQVETIELNSVLEQVNSYFEDPLREHNITLQIELSADKPKSVANYLRLQEVFMNLISNAREALQNTTQAIISIKTWQQVEKAGFTIEDNGAGIPAEQQQNLFLPFHSTKAHGMGLGLYLAHKALSEMNATIQYQDRVPHGACFIIEFPTQTGAIHE